MIDDKYFTPSIEDIRVGYECQLRNNASAREHWLPEKGLAKLSKDDISRIVFKLANWEKNVRVSYLTKEQIEAEGWKSPKDSDFPITAVGLIYRDSPFFKNGYRMDYNYEKKMLRIETLAYSTLYEGECKDINTFRYISKLLGI